MELASLSLDLHSIDFAPFIFLSSICHDFHESQVEAAATRPAEARSPSLVELWTELGSVSRFHPLF